MKHRSAASIGAQPARATAQARRCAASLAAAVAVAVAVAASATMPAARAAPAEPGWRPQHPVTLVVPYAPGGYPVMSTPQAFVAQIEREDAYFGALARRFPFDE